MAIYRTDSGSISNLTSDLGSITELTAGAGADTFYVNTDSINIKNGFYFRLTEIDSTDSPYSIQKQDSAIIVNTLGSVNIDLSGADPGRFIMIKDGSGNATSRNITFSGATIDGGTYTSISSNWGGVILYNYKGDWVAISKF